MRFLLRNFSKLINIGRRNIYRWNSANLHRLLIASMYKLVCIHRVLMLTLRFPPFCCLSYQWSISRIVTLRIVTRFIGLSSPFSRRFPVRSFSFDVNTKNSEIRVSPAKAFRRFNNFLAWNHHLSFSPSAFSFVLAVFGVASKHVDGNIIVRISRGGIRWKLCASLCARES